jgi:hypothetical protein
MSAATVADAVSAVAVAGAVLMCSSRQTVAVAVGEAVAVAGFAVAVAGEDFAVAVAGVVLRCSSRQTVGVAVGGTVAVAGAVAVTVVRSYKSH